MRVHSTDELVFTGTGPSLTRDRRAEIDTLFSEILDVPGSARATRLDRVETDDPELSAAVRDLLAAAERPNSLLDARLPLRDLIVDIESLGTSDSPVGTRVGPYLLVQEIGRGGTSVVYLAERVDGSFAQRVALKFLTLAAADDRAIRRFEQERQILATLDHPNIARLIDGGTDERGCPYIAMEYVQGRHIDVFCNEAGLGLDGRLELVRVVAQAVEYAHRHLVVHRDLKPSNILITDSGRVKLLDFGIARLLEPTAGGTFVAPPTRTAVRVLTPEYASPEQIRGDAVTTASDVYQIAVVLYELLTGQRPFSLRGGTPSELERAICTDEPVRPSAARSRHAPAGIRALEPPDAVRRRLRGDLDAIVLKALAKDAVCRYGTVNELLDDMRRFQDGRPVQARPPAWAYRTSRFVRRHRLAVGAAVLLTVSLAGGVAGTIWQAVVANQERQRAETARSDAVAAAERAARIQLALTDLVLEANPWSGGRLAEGSAGLIERAIAQVDNELALEPDAQAAMLERLVEILYRMEDYQRSAELAARALVLRLALRGPYHESVADSIHDLGASEWRQRRYAEAQLLFELALARYRQTCGECPRVVSMLSYLGTVHYYEGRFEPAEALLRDALDRRRRVMGPEHVSVAVSLNNLALVLAATDRLEEAEALHRDALGMRRARLGEHPQTAHSQVNLATVLLRRGDAARLSEAEELVREALAARQALLGPGHSHTVKALRVLASIERARGKPASAARSERRASEGERARDVRPAGPDGRTFARLASLFDERGDGEAAGVFARVALRHAAAQDGAQGGATHAEICRAVASVTEECGG